MDARRWLEAFNRLEAHIEQVWGVPVRVRDVPSPFTGDLDGTEIHVDYNEEPESAVFIIIHLFGHTVQWNTSADSREVGLAVFKNPSDEELSRLREYEIEAARYSLQLLHDCGLTELDQWVSDFAACDYRYLSHLFRTGERQPFRSFWRDGEPLLTPKPIPRFQPKQWVYRWQGIVA